MAKKIGSWDLRMLLANVHDDVEAQLDSARQALGHPTDKGDSSESVWIDLFNTYLPRRYHTIRGHIADSNGEFSEQIDLIVHDRQYTPLIFTFKNVEVVPAESVYAVFESKQEMNAEYVEAAKQKLASVRRLQRTSGRITAHGLDPATASTKAILGGILTLESAWNPPFEETLRRNLTDEDPNRVLDLGCVASKGMFVRQGDEIATFTEGKHATRFLFKLMSMLQSLGTVPAIEMDKYERFLDSSVPSNGQATQE